MVGVGGVPGGPCLVSSVSVIKGGGCCVGGVSLDCVRLRELVACIGVVCSVIVSCVGRCCCSGV